MNTKDIPKNKKKISAVDIMIVILLLLCAAGAVIRVTVGETNLFSKESKGDYIISYVVFEHRDEYSDYFAQGCEFYLEDGELLGALTGNATFTPAEIRSENSAGQYVSGYATDGTVDVKGSLLVKGTMTESGFLLSSGTYLAPNLTVTAKSSDITVEMLITDITKAQ